MHVYVRFTKLVLIVRVTTYDLRQVTSPITEVKTDIVSFRVYFPEADYIKVHIGLIQFFNYIISKTVQFLFST